MDTPLRSVVGGKTATALDKAFGLVTVRDLLRHYPRRYDEQGQLTDLAKLEVGEEATVMAEVSKVQGRHLHRAGQPAPGTTGRSICSR